MSKSLTPEEIQLLLNNRRSLTTNLMMIWLTLIIFGSLIALTLGLYRLIIYLL